MFKLLFIFLLIAAVWYSWSHPVIPAPGGSVTLESIVTPFFSPHTSSIGCTMEAKICPDGSSVGRIGPSCEFAKCPGE